MEFSFTTSLLKELKHIKTRQPQRYKKIQKQLLYFQQDPLHPSLRTHKLQGELSHTWSITIEGNLRMVYYISKKKAVFFLIGNHDDVYQK